MILRDFLIRRTLLEGGNVTIGRHQAQHIDLKVTKRSYIVPILAKLLADISTTYAQQYKENLWDQIGRAHV